MKINLLGALLLGAAAAWPVSLDLAPPGLTAFVGTSGVVGDRGIFLTANSSFSIARAGIYMDPLSGGATQIQASLYQADAGTLSVVALLGSHTASITDNGLALYEVAVNFNFTAGQTYYLAFDVTAPPGSFGASNNLEFFNSHLSPFTVGGLTVLDGAMGGVFQWTVMPHIVLNTEPGAPPPTNGGGATGGGAGAVPEPSTWMMLGSALLLPALGRLKRS
jgi:hypothetical protein